MKIVEALLGDTTNRAESDPMPARGREHEATDQNNNKLEDLETFRDDPRDAVLTTDQGVAIPHTDDSLKIGARGPSLIEDFHLREKITHFDHERIPERVVHARGAGAHGVFQVYSSLEDFTSAAFLCDPELETPVFVRFSTVVGSRGSADTVRDVRGFATKFYTQAGNFDLVGNNMPVFFIQDGIKFPDLVHAIKPEPANEIPQAQSAHDSFWDFVSLVPETAHMVMWVMSDRAIPRSYRMMEGFGVHTFRLINDRGASHLVKFHWKPLLGAHSLIWEEAQKLAGLDPDFHRRDLWNAIERGIFPEWELGLQVIAEGQAKAYSFDLLDATKLIPEELVPVRRVGRLTLNRNPQNFFAETEQIAFHVGNVVPGIDVTNDPLMQARLFSYLDTQLTRLGGPNFAEIPINRPIAPVANHQQDGFHRTTINTGVANYHPNSIGGGCPFLSGRSEGYVHHREPVDGSKERVRSDSFLDHFSQATLFLNSQSPTERQHLIDACCFEVSKVTRKEVRQRVLGMFHQIDPSLAEAVSRVVGATPIALTVPPGTAMPTHRGDNGGLEASAALSLDNQPKDSIRGRVVACLVTHGFDGKAVNAMRRALQAQDATLEVVAPLLGAIADDNGNTVDAQKTFKTGASVFYDGVFVPHGSTSPQRLHDDDDVLAFVLDSIRHCKTVALVGDGALLLNVGDALPQAEQADLVETDGLIVARSTTDPDRVCDAFTRALARHRHWSRAEQVTPQASP